MTAGLLVIGLAASPGPAVSADTRMPAYAAAVEEYASGDRQRAVHDVMAWEPAGLARMTAAVIAPRPPRAPRDPYREAVRRRFPAAVMLHTQAGLVLNWRNDAAGAWRHWHAATALAELHPATFAQESFLRGWYHAFGLFLVGSYDVDRSIEILGRGRDRFPDDIALALALGQAHEARGARVPTDLAAAEILYRDILAREPSLGEARLRLGHVLGMQGRQELALVALRQAAAATTDPRLRYLARLFAGRVLRESSRLPEAEDELSLAVAAWPAGQAAALSLAEIRHARGERTAAAAVLSPALAPDGLIPGPDPFRSYTFGDRAEHKRLLEAAVERATRASADADEIVSRTFVTGGARRTYSAYAPSSATPRPLVILLHGSGQSGYAMVEQWKDLAKREGIVIAGPDASDPAGWQPPQDGPELLRDLVEALSPQNVDQRRVYLFGYSAGAVFALHMGPLEPGFFAAAAIHAGAYGGEAGLEFLDRAPRKIPLFLSVGTKDDLFPPSTVAATVRRLERAGFPVTTSLVEGGRHDYRPSREINERAWAFLRQHALASDPVFVPVRFTRD